MGLDLFGHVDVDITEGAKIYSPIIHQPFEVFSPQYQMDYSYAPMVAIESPGARGAVITTKKEAASEPYVGGAEVTAPTTGAPPDITGTILMLGLLGAGALIVTTVLKKKHKK